MHEDQINCVVSPPSFQELPPPLIGTTDTFDTTGFTGTTNCSETTYYTCLQAAVESITRTQASMLDIGKIEDFMKGSSNVAFPEYFLKNYFRISFTWQPSRPESSNC